MIGFSVKRFLLTMLVLAAVALVVTIVRKRRLTKEARARILEGQFTRAQDFAADEVGEDYPGCFIFLVFDREVADGDYANYREAHVGRSATARAEARERVVKLAQDLFEQGRKDEASHIYVQVRPYDEDVLDKRMITIGGVLDAQ